MWQTFTAAVLVTVLIGCGPVVGTGVGPSPQPEPPAQPQSQRLADNWHIMTASEHVPGNVSALMGALTEIDGSITGTVQIWVSACFYPDNAIHVKGSLSDGQVTLTGSTFGQTFELTATLSPDHQRMEGRYTIAGGCADGDFGTLIGLRIPDLSGTWTGSMQSYYPGEPAKQITSMTLTQSRHDRGDGWFEVTGTATLAMSCFTHASVRGAVIGRELVLELVDAEHPERYVRIVGHTNDLGTQAGEGAKPLTGWIMGGDNHYIFLFGCDDEGIPFLSKADN